MPRLITVPQPSPEASIPHPTCSAHTGTSSRLSLYRGSLSVVHMVAALSWVSVTSLCLWKGSMSAEITTDLINSTCPPEDRTDPYKLCCHLYTGDTGKPKQWKPGQTKMSHNVRRPSDYFPPATFHFPITAGEQITILELHMSWCLRAGT